MIAVENKITAQIGSHWAGLPLQWQQMQAASSAIKSLSESSRIQILMACGSGKTLVGAYVATELGAQRVLVLVPSLSLMNQTLMAWMENGALEGARLLCVCSDASTGTLDSIEFTGEEMLAPVSTDSAVVRGQLSRNGRHITFCTYQSAKLLASSLPSHYQFDLALFDEAHRTAGQMGGQFTIGLDDLQISARRRIFLTATPKHYSVASVDQYGERRALFSMDNEEIYGPVAYRLGFREAIDTGVICDYRVVVSAITGEQIDSELRRLGQVQDATGQYSAAMLSNQVSLAKAFEALPVKRAITFHSSVRGAEIFARDEKHILASVGVKMFHVSGKMLSAHRKSIIAEFDACAGPAVLTNARCLTEGVDLPYVDMVGFMDAKSSQLDIAQAVGRAMRRAKGKALGYVLLPLYVGQDVSEVAIDAAVKREGYGVIWDVLATMQEQDAQFGNALSSGRTARANAQSKDGDFLKNMLVLSSAGFVEQLHSSIATMAINRLTSSWEENFALTKKYKQENDGRDPPQGLIANGRNLGIWCNHQRALHKRSLLALDKFERLQAIKFRWEVLAERFEEMFDLLLSYKEANGHVNLSVYESWREQPLGEWVARQRRLKIEGRISAERIERLDAIGFVWKLEEGYERFIRALKEQFAKQGNVAVAAQSDWKPMAAWFRKIRALKHEGELTPKQIEEIESCGFVWATPDPYDAGIGKLVRFKNRYGHCRTIPSTDDDPEFLGLHKWIQAQRHLQGKGRMSVQRYQELSSLGIQWERVYVDWEIGFSELQRFRQENGHIDVSMSFVTAGGYELGDWFSRQRSSFRRGTLSAEKHSRLEEIGMKIELKSDAWWSEHFSELREYFRKYPNTTIGAEAGPLYNWVCKQRSDNRAGILPPERKARLLEAGLDLTVYEAMQAKAKARRDVLKAKQQARIAERSEERILAREAAKRNFALERWKSDLAKFKKPEGELSARSRGRWLVKQRAAMRAGDLQPWQLEALAASGLELDRGVHAGASRFEEMIGQLKALVSVHGTLAKMLASGEVSASMQKWFYDLRLDRKAHALDGRMIAELDGVGFEWSTLESKWDLAFEQLREAHSQTRSLDKDGLPKKLYQWLIGQRLQYAEGTLSQKRIDQLNSIGMDWSTREDAIENNLRYLENLFNELGTISPPGVTRTHPKVVQYVHHFKRLRENGRLNSEQIERLDAVGIRWSVGGRRE